jgi:P pilus assembly chaperone PapD
MLKALVGTLALIAALVWVTPGASAAALDDVRVDKDKDDKRNTIYSLVNSGSKPILVRVEHRKDCPGMSNNKPPSTRNYLVEPGRSIQLRKVWAESSCEHDFVVLKAAYYVKKRS